MKKFKIKASEPTKVKIPKRDRSRDTTVGVEEMENLLSHVKQVDHSDTEMPKLQHCGIDIQGLEHSGKSTAIAGNPHLIIIKLPDSNPQLSVRRCRARVIIVNNLEEFWDAINSLLKFAKTYGTSSKWCQICIDPIITLYEWMAEEEVKKYNSRFEDETGEVFEGQEDKIAEDLSDIPGWGPYRKIGRKIKNIFNKFRGLGWGWICITHYTWKSDSMDDDPDWKPDLPRTAALPIRQIADIVLSTEIIDKEFYVHYRSDRLGSSSRVPLNGSCKLPSYDGDFEGTSWDCIARDYNRACRRLMKDEEKFRKRERQLQKSLDAID